MQIVLFHDGSKAIDGVVIPDDDVQAVEIKVLRFLTTENPTGEHNVQIVAVQTLQLIPGDLPLFHLLSILSASPNARRHMSAFRTLGRLLAQTFNQGREFENGTGKTH